MKLLDKIKTNRLVKQQEESVIGLIEDIMEEREERGDSSIVDSREIPMLKNLFRLRDVRAHDVMTPRVDMDAVPLEMTQTKFCKHIAEDKFTRYPVYDGVLDNIVGIVHVKDVLYSLITKRKCLVKDVMTPHVLFVSPAMRALDLLKEMQSKQVQMAIVVDEHGGVDGLVSLEDLLEVVVGEIDDEHDEPDELQIKRLSGSSVEVNAKLHLSDFERDVYPVATEAERKNSDIDTIGGWVVNLAGHVPQKGEVVLHQPTGIRFLILSSDTCCIRRMKVMNIPKKEETND